MSVADESGAEHFMSPDELTLGEKLEFVFPPMSCFDMEKLQQEIMKQDSGSTFRGNTVIMTHLENLIKLYLMKSGKGQFGYSIN